MQGVIIIVGRTQSMILGDDGIRYSFPTLDWRNDEISPKVGMRVSFEARGPQAMPQAMDVRPIPDSAAPDTEPDAASDPGQRGTIRRVARADRPGVIEGEDGAEYTYTSADWQIDSFNPIAGMRVGFTARGSSVTSVGLPGRPPQTSGSANVSSSRAPGLSPRASSDSGETVAPASVPSTTAPDTDRDAASDLNLQGTIQRVARADLPGVIQGDDGVQYIYTTADWQFDSFRTYAGERVNFLGRGSSATSVQPVRFHTPKTRRRIRGRIYTFAITASKLLILVLAVLAVVVVIDVVNSQPIESHLTAYQAGYLEQIDAGRSPRYASAYASQILNGESVNYAHTYAGQIDAGRSPTYASAYTSQIINDESANHALAYAQQLSAGHLHWYAYTYSEMIDFGKSPTYANAYAEFIESVFPIPSKYPEFSMIHEDVFAPEAYARAYARLVDDGKSSTYARAYADAQFVYFLGGHATEIAEEVDSARARASRALPDIPALSPIDAAAVLAMYSTTDDTEADKRATSVREMTTYVGRGDMDNDTALGLLAHIAPGASIDERVEAASRLASISDNSDGELTQEQTMEVANELTRLITGHGIDAEQRAGAAREMVRLSQSGELNADNAAELMDTIAPEWSVTERKEALGYLALQFSEGEWDADSAKRTAEEGYTLITGGEIQMERRMEASIELAGEGLKRYGGDSYDDEGVDQAVALTQGAIRGDLNIDSVANILGVDVDNRNTMVDEKSTRYSESYAEQIARGESKIYAKAYARQRTAGKSRKYARYYAAAIDRGESEAYAHAYGRVWNATEGSGFQTFFPYGEFIDEGKSWKYAYIANIASEYYDEYYVDSDSAMRLARIYMSQLSSGKSAGYADTYTEQIGVGRSESYAHTYADQLGAGRSENYAHTYADQLGSGKSERYARAYADQNNYYYYRHDYAEQISAGRSENYAHAYAYAIPSWGKNHAHIFAELFSAGKSVTYASDYTTQIVAGKSVTYANAYASQLITVRSRLLAHGYAWLVDLVN